VRCRHVLKVVSGSPFSQTSDFRLEDFVVPFDSPIPRDLSQFRTGVKDEFRAGLVGLAGSVLSYETENVTLLASSIRSLSRLTSMK
jgi:hypothetical protein